jgi:hypothetical protein
MSGFDPAQDAPDRAAPDFDAAADQLFAETDAPQDAPAAAQPTAAPAEAAPVQEAAPAQDEPDDDDEGLPLETRFSRAQRREQRLAAERETLATERQRAIDQANGYKGNLVQEKRRREEAEAKSADFEKALTNANTRRDAEYEAAIRYAPDEPDGTGRPTKTDLTRDWNVEKRERDVAQKEARIQFAEQQREEEIKTWRETQRGEAERGVRQHAISEIARAIAPTAEALGLPASEVKDLVAALERPEVAILLQNLPAYDPDPNKWDVHKYRSMVLAQTDQAIAQRAAAYRERQAGQTRQELGQTTYRAEQPVGAGGGGQYRDLRPLQDAGDFDATFDALNANYELELQGVRR